MTAQAAANPTGRSEDAVPSTHQKALAVNLDATSFGSFAEIGAGQEVARWFLRVGGASGTVAKTIGAYDKEVSDDLYGSGTRYVSRPRVEAMLGSEWKSLVHQVGAARGKETRHFAYANTIAARNFAGTNDCHGWIGVRFQDRPGGEASDILLHVNLRDNANLLQQEAVGIMGVNLLHALLNERAAPGDVPARMFDNLAGDRVEVDQIEMRGNALAGCDLRGLHVGLARDGRAEILEQTGTLATMDLARPWRAGASEGPIADNWLASFDDAQLDALVAEAMVNNPDLCVTATRVEIAAQYVELAEAQLRPAVNLFGTGGLNMGGGDVSSALQGISLGVSWEPDLWARMRYGRNAAQSTYASAQADFEFGRQSLAATIAKGWFTASETGLQLETAQGMVKAAQELVTLAETRQRVGPGREEDVALARANLGTFQDAEKQVQLAHSQALRALELLVGRYPSAELSARRDLVRLPGAIPTGLPIEMLERRPDMIAAERRVAAAFNRVGEAKAARLPRIILNANVAAIQSDILQLKSDFQNPTGGVGAKLIVPIYDGVALGTQLDFR